MLLDYDPCELIPLSEVNPILTESGMKAVSRQTVWLWAKHGLKKERYTRKRVYLRTVNRAGRHFTVKRWVLHFLMEFART